MTCRHGHVIDDDQIFDLIANTLNHAHECRGGYVPELMLDGCNACCTAVVAFLRNLLLMAAWALAINLLPRAQLDTIADGPAGGLAQRLHMLALKQIYTTYQNTLHGHR